MNENALSGLVNQIVRRFDAKSAAIGISMPIASIVRAPAAWRQARFSSESAADPGVRYCRDLALPFLLETLRNEPATADLLHPALAALSTYDEGARSDLPQTLRTYVATGCNQAECARRLHVHLNTLKYRLRRIEELTGLDLKDQDDLFYLRLSIELEQ